MAEVGPQLLGRIPSPPDERDFKVRFLKAASPLEITLAQLVASKGVAPATKNWAKEVTKVVLSLTPAPQPEPTPDPTLMDVVWNDPDQLDQLDQATCVGHGVAQWGNTSPVNDHFTHEDALDLYFDATTFDGAPDDPRKPNGGQQGATGRSGMKALLKRKRNSAYALAKDLAEIQDWLRTKGPVVVGTDWMNDMFHPDKNGYVKATGSLQGGHCYIIVGDLPSEGALLFQNSWGKNWGLDGYFKMKYTEFQKLLDRDGEAWVSVELPL